MNDDLPARLAALGHEFERAIRVQLSEGHPRRARGRRRSRRFVLGGVAMALAIPGAAIAAQQLLSTQQVAASLPAGTRALIGTDPTCTVVTAGVEYHCTLASPPSDAAPVATPAGGAANAGVVPFKVARGAHGTPRAGAGGACRAVLFKLARGGRVAWRIVGARDRCGIRLAPAAAGATGSTGAAAALGVSGATGASGPTAATGASGASGASAFDWTGTVDPTVDASRHVNGGCRALDAAGTSWECYIGQAAVTQNIIGAGFLGQYAPVPGVG